MAHSGENAEIQRTQIELLQRMTIPVPKPPVFDGNISRVPRVEKHPWSPDRRSSRYSNIPAFLSWRILQQSSTKSHQRPVRITDKRCLYAYMRNWSPCVNSAELPELSDFHVMTQETTKSVVYLKGLESYSAIRELAPCLPSNYSNKWSLTAGIWFSLSFIRSMHKAPRHRRAWGLCEITSSFLTISQNFCLLFVSVFFMLWILNRCVMIVLWYLWVIQPCVNKLSILLLFLSSRISCAAIYHFSYFTTSWTLLIVYGFVYNDNYSVSFCLWFWANFMVFEDIYGHRTRWPVAREKPPRCHSGVTWWRHQLKWHHLKYFQSRKVKSYFCWFCHKVREFLPCGWLAINKYN